MMKILNKYTKNEKIESTHPRNKRAHEKAAPEQFCLH